MVTKRLHENAGQIGESFEQIGAVMIVGSRLRSKILIAAAIAQV